MHCCLFYQSQHCQSWYQQQIRALWPFYQTEMKLEMEQAITREISTVGARILAKRAVCVRFAIGVATLAFVVLCIAVNNSFVYYKNGSDKGLFATATRLTIEMEDCMITIRPSTSSITTLKYRQVCVSSGGLLRGKLYRHRQRVVSFSPECRPASLQSYFFHIQDN